MIHNTEMSTVKQPLRQGYLVRDEGLSAHLHFWFGLASSERNPINSLLGPCQANLLTNKAM